MHWRHAHIDAGCRGALNPPLLGMLCVLGEGVVRRAVRRIEERALPCFFKLRHGAKIEMLLPG